MTMLSLREYVGSLGAAAERRVEAEVLTAPALLTGDGSSSTWACDVRIPGHVEDLEVRNVPIASSAESVRWATPGNAVEVMRSPGTGQMEIVGFSKRRPGTFVRVAVSIDTAVAGAEENVALSSHAITLGELADFAGGFDLCPLGATAVYRGATLIRVV